MSMTLKGSRLHGLPLAYRPPTDETPAGTMQKAAVWMPTKHMGNLLVSLRALEALVRHFGASHTALVIDSGYRPIIECLDLRCEVVYFPRGLVARSPWWRQLFLMGSFLRTVRALAADTTIALEGDLPSLRLIPFCRPGHTVAPENAFSTRMKERIALDHGQQHRFHDYAHVVKRVTGRQLEPGYPALAVGVGAQQGLERSLSALGIAPDKPIAVLHPGATKYYKQWPVTHFATLARALHRQGYQLVLTGAGERDGTAITALRQLGDTPMTSLHDRLSIAELIALCRQAALFVGNDTGPTHLAAAAGTRTVALFGPTDEHRWGPMGANVRIVRHPLPCPPDCHRGRCSLDHRCINTLAAEPVLAAIEALS